MKTAVQNLISPASVQATQFPPTSRYYGLGMMTAEQPDGRTVIYLDRRIVPLADTFRLLQTHTVTQGERLDTIANVYLGDPLAFWRICDANGAMRPEELTETLGRTLKITLPAGISS